MIIGFDAVALLGPLSKNRGIGNYCKSLFNTLIDNHPDDEFVCLNYFEESVIGSYLDARVNLHEVSVYMGRDCAVCGNSAYKDVFGAVVRKFVTEELVDVFCVTSPFDSHVQCYEKVWFGQTPVVAIVYDIIPWIFKEHYIKGKRSVLWYQSIIETLRSYEKLLVISQSVKDDLIRCFDFSASEIDVIWGACDSRFRPLDIREDIKDELSSRYDLSGDFILCTGGDDDRKNIASLIRAYGKLDSALIHQYQLVVVCKISDQSRQNYLSIARRMGIEDRVCFTGFVSDEDLLILYNLAYACVFPSKYEGFGLPVVEAFACHKPVLTSNNSSLVQIAGDAAVLVDPFSEKDISRGITELLTADVAPLISRGTKRNSVFTWGNVSDAVYNAYSVLTSGEGSLICSNKNRIAFFTPLPPMQSGIADYSYDCIKAISKYFEVDVYIDEGYTPEVVFSSNVKIYSHREFREKNYLRIIYQMGNSEFHEYMLPYIENHPGILELHDINLHGLVARMLSQNAISKKQYISILKQDERDPVVRSYVSAFESGRVCSVNPHACSVNGLVANSSKSIIVHSDWAKERLLTRNIAYRIRTIRLYADADCDLVQTDNVIPQIASFGIIAETKRIIPILQALQLLKEDGLDFHYNVVGRNLMLNDSDLTCLIEKLGLKENVTITGHIPLEEMLSYMRATDICLNLRYPYNGETSATLMRMLGMGKCVIVNDIGSFSEIPDEACFKIPSVEEMGEAEEIGVIYQALATLIKEKTRRDSICTKANEYASSELSLDRIVAEYRRAFYADDWSGLTESHMQSLALDEIQGRNYNQNEKNKLINTLAYAVL